MDGVLPGNDGRDYVLRRIIRRAVQQAVAIGIEKPFLATLTNAVVDQMGGAYPSLEDARPEIRRVAHDEEVRFRRTLDQGMGILEEALRRASGTGATIPRRWRSNSTTPTGSPSTSRERSPRNRT